MSNIVKGKGPVVDSGVCRCCGSVKRCRFLNVEYCWQGQTEVYSEIFVDCFGLVLSYLEGEDAERLICATCVTRLRDASIFRQQVLQNEERLLSSFIQLHDDDKLNEEKPEDDIVNNEKEDKRSDDEKAMSDGDYNGMEPVPEEFTCEDTNLTTPKKRTRILKGKSSNNVLTANGLKRIIVNRSDIKTTDIQKTTDKSEPSFEIHTLLKKIIQSNNVKDRPFQNAVTIVENSYACPFSSVYNTFYCIYCRKKFIDADKLREHTLNHDPKTYEEILKNIQQKNSKCQIDFHRIDCRLCNQKIDDYKTFQTHITNVHGKRMYHTSVDIVLKFSLTNANLKCMECEQVFPSFHLLKLHMANHFGAFVCEVCGLHHFEERNLKAHLKSHRPTEAVYTCSQCGKSFKCKYNLTIHIARLHTKEAPYLCTVCDESFFSKSLRSKHMVDVHNDDSIFKCKSCDKVYSNRKQLVQHNKWKHLRILKHPCNICEMKFFSPAYLKEHMYSHTGERNYHCEHCGKRYPRLKALKVHMQAHATEKKYKCSMCNASYSQNVCLKNHVKRQHVTV